MIRSNFSLANAICEIQYAENGDIWYGSVRGGLVFWTGQKAEIIVKEREDGYRYVRSILPNNQGCSALLSDGRVIVFENGIFKDRDNIITPADESIYSAIPLEEASFLFISRNLKSEKNYIKKWNGRTSVSEVIWEESTKSLLFDALAVSPNKKIYGIGRKLESGTPTADLVLLDLAPRTQRIIEKISSRERVLTMTMPKSETILVATDKSKRLSRYSLGEDQIRPDSLSERVRSEIDSVMWMSDMGFGWKNGADYFVFDLSNRQLRKASAPVVKSELDRDIRLEQNSGIESNLNIRFSNGIIKPIQLITATDQIATAHKIVTYENRKLILVGHRFGTSVFSIEKNLDLKLIRKLVGHSDDVTGIDFRAESGLVLTSGRDGTICCFSLTPWKFHPELGASFKIQDGQLLVDKMDPGSPIWETGLDEGEPIEQMFYRSRAVELANALQVLNNPAIGEQFQFQTRRLLQGVSTRSLQRPIWKFYANDEEWIWWRWRDFYYDCSTLGERLVAWQLNPGFDQSPILVEGTEARARFYRPEKMTDLLSQSRTAPERINAPDLVPPRVAMTIEERQDHFLITTSLEPELNALLVGEPKELSVWVNDYRVASWSNPEIDKSETCRLAKSLLRSGNNRVIARAFNSIGIRGDSEAEMITREAKATSPVLRGLAIGIKDYSGSRQLSEGGKGRIANDLQFTVRDAISLRRLLQKQSSAFVVNARDLLDAQATRENIFLSLESIGKECQPDDWLVLSFSGHGCIWDKPPESNLPNSFMLVTSGTSLVSESEALQTAIPVGGLDGGLEFESLFNALSGVSCRKLLLIDACHSGGALEIVKALTPDLVVGPTIISASQKSQKAHEAPQKTHGIFTEAILEGLTSRFDITDTTSDERVSPRELYEYTLRRVPEIFRNSSIFIDPSDFKLGQTPEFWSPSEDQDIPIFARVTK
jgi:hypothetical protein